MFSAGQMVETQTSSVCPANYGRPFASNRSTALAALVCGPLTSSQTMSSASLDWSVSDSQIVGRNSGSDGRGVWQR